MKILFGVLDWGLGHATRDIPVIDELIREGHEVNIISTGRAMLVLKKCFGKKCNYFDIPSCKPHYTKTGFFMFNFVMHLPVIYKELKDSRKIIAELIKKGKYDKIISDGRYDIYDNDKNSYTLIHQIRYASFFGLNHIGDYAIAKLLKPYKKIIVLDYKDNKLAGTLSKPSVFLDKKKLCYVGVLSMAKKKYVKKDIDYYISISGPEPQRTIFEDILFKQIKGLNGRVVLARGIPESKEKKTNGKLTIFDHLNYKEQEDMLNKSKFIICRSGYTTMMEFGELGVKKALLIPTPGQQEQECLAEEYEKKGLFYHVHQNEINLKEDISKCKEFKGFNLPWKTKESVKKVMGALDL